MANGIENLKSQIVISSWGGFRRAVPCIFTEQGVTMPPVSCVAIVRDGRTFMICPKCFKVTICDLKAGLAHYNLH